MEVIVILGAAVRPDGRPSPALDRRIGYGARAAEAAPHAPVFCSGAPGAAGPSEASVIAQGLGERRIGGPRIVLDEASRDTLQTVVAACRYIRLAGLSGAVVCTDAYHLPRARMLFARLGVPTRPGPVPRGPSGGWRGWMRMQLREWLAYPYDLGVVLVRRRTLLAIIEAPPEHGPAGR